MKESKPTKGGGPLSDSLDEQLTWDLKIKSGGKK